MPNSFPPTRRPVGPVSTRYLNIFTCSLVIFISAILVLPLALPGRVQLAIDQPAPTDYYSPQDMRYESDVLTEQDRQKAQENAEPVYDYKGSQVEEGRRRLNETLLAIGTIRGDVDVPDPTRADRLDHLPGLTATSTLTLDPAGKATLLTTTPETYSRLRSEALRVYDNLMNNGKIENPTQLDAVRADLPQLFSADLAAGERQAAAAVVGPFLRINLVLNQEATAGRRQAAVAAVQPHIVDLQRGEVILRVGQLADPVAIEKLEKLGLLNPTVTPTNAGAVTGCVAIMLILLHFYLLRLQPAIWANRRPLILLGLVLGLPTLAMRVIVPGHAIWPYLLPVAAASMLIAVLLDANLAIVITVVLSIFAALTTQGNLGLPFFYLTGGITAVFAIWRAERVITFALSGSYITAVSLAATLLIRLVENQHLDWPAVGVLASAAAINGALSSTLTFATFSVLGSLFGIATMLQLLELAHPNQPLLRRLMREAPGTYHHSLVVSNLAEHAAQLVDADPLLARVSAYYHDIGKVLNPHAFVENQAGVGNIHDTLDPLTSARLVRDHITGGQDLAERSRLPRRVIDAIPQHHGTSVIKYFYYNALRDDPGVAIEDFRYPGPKPQSKEAAILMLADSTEATVRAVAQAGKLEMGPSDPAAEPPPNSIVDIVQRTIKDRLEDGQLDECDLTIRDLARIQAAFCTMLSGIYHPRITYPDKPGAEAPAGKRPAGNADGAPNVINNGSAAHAGPQTAEPGRSYANPSERTRSGG